jgi:hypothetical protein
MITCTLTRVQAAATPHDREQGMGPMVFGYTGAGFPHGLREEYINQAERRMDAPEVIPAGAMRSSWAKPGLSIELPRVWVHL